MDDDSDKPSAEIKRLPVRFKAPPGKEPPVLKVVEPYARDGCNHRYRFEGSRMVNATYIVREGETEVECGFCAVKLDPMWVLKQLAGRETEYERHREIAQQEMARLQERERTQCQHCGKMTKISRAKVRKKS